MEPTVTTSTQSYGLAVALLIVGLVIGAAAGYYYASMMQETAPVAETPTAAQPAAVEAAATTNPYAQVETNPYDVQVNPFQ